MATLEEIAGATWDVVRTNLCLNDFNKITDLPAGAYTILADTALGALVGIYSVAANGGSLRDICFVLSSRTAAGFVYSIAAIDAGALGGMAWQIAKNFLKHKYDVMDVLDNTNLSSPKAL